MPFVFQMASHATHLLLKRRNQPQEKLETVLVLWQEVIAEHPTSK